MSKMSLYYNETNISKSPKSLTEAIEYNLSHNLYGNLYLFNLKIITTDGEKIFKYNETTQHSNLIKSSDKILYSDLKKYEVTINYNDNLYHLTDSIYQNSSFYTGQNNNMFIDFSQDDLGYTICTCYYITKDINTLCISPPN